jgi:hypothetical protein
LFIFGKDHGWFPELSHNTYEEFLEDDPIGFSEFTDLVFGMLLAAQAKKESM